VIAWLLANDAVSNPFGDEDTLGVVEPASCRAMCHIPSQTQTCALGWRAIDSTVGYTPSPFKVTFSLC